MEDSTDRAPKLDSTFTGSFFLTQLYLGETFVFEYTGHVCTDIHIWRKGRIGGKQTNTVELFILVYNSRLGKKYGMVRRCVF